MGTVQTIESGSDVTITLNGNNGDITTGGANTNGALIIKNTSEKEILHIGHFLISLSNNTIGQEVRIQLNDKTGNVRIRLTEDGEVLIGGNGAHGSIALKSDKGTDTLQMNGADGSIALKNDKGTERIQMDGAQGSVRVRSSALVMVYELDGNTGEIILQGVKAPGHGSPRIRLQPEGANILLGGSERAGHLFMNNNDGKDTIHLDGGNANVYMGGHQQAGNLFINNKNGKDTIHLDGGTADLYMGGNEQAGNLFINDKKGNNTIHLDGDIGDITLTNADCAEEFDVSELQGVEPGTVMVLDHEGKLQRSREAYDKKVAGVISGAGDFKPGIVLDKKVSDNRMPLALVGKVWCRVDAQYSPIEVGDLLTTSPTPGHAMKAGDPLKAFGAVIGKALRPLSEGCGFIPILIALQ